MIHDVDSVEMELTRLRERPDPALVPPVLSVFTVELQDQSVGFRDRLTSVLDVALQLGITEEFEDEDLPTGDLPDWFVEVSSQDSARAPIFARRGREQYLHYVASGPWPLQDWLYRFCPEEDSRGWSWWDITHDSRGSLHVWVDSWGEDFFGCDDLRWLAYTAGAKELSGPHLARPEEWANEISNRP